MCRSIGLVKFSTVPTLAFDFDFSFDKSSNGTIKVAAANVGLSLGDGTNGVSITNASGALVLSPNGIAGRVEGTVALTIPDVTFAGTFGIAVNSSNAPVSETFMLGDDLVNLDLPVGPYVRVEGTNVELTIAGQTLTGNAAFEQGVDADGGTVVTVALTDVSLSLGSGTDPIVSVTNGQGAFLITDAGLAGRLSATINITVPGDAVEFDGNFLVEISGCSSPAPLLAVLPCPRNRCSSLFSPLGLSKRSQSYYPTTHPTVYIEERKKNTD